MEYRQYNLLNDYVSDNINEDIERNKPSLGTCLGAFSSTFSVAFLEPHMNKHNPFSLLNRIADHSLEAQDIMVKMESSMPNLETIPTEIDQFIESEETYVDSPHIIDVILPLLYSYIFDSVHVKIQKFV